MTEAEWWSATDPRAMMGFLRGKASDRRMRLFACGCCRRFPVPLMDEGRAVKGVVAAEQFADDLLTPEQAAANRAEAEAVARSPATWSVYWALDPNPWTAAVQAGRHAPDDFQVRLLHDLVGALPLSPVVPDRSWLTSDVRSLAEGIYQDRAFDRLLILADALQDAGCVNEDVLTHCRGPGPHFRGCWVIDLLLGKE